MNITLPRLNLPQHEFRINGDQIFDVIRKKWVTITPEEWVRQNFISYLMHEKGYPKSLIRIEETIKAFEKTKRCDVVIYSSEIVPLVIIECKKTETKISKKTFEQVAIYNSSLMAKYLIVTNGLDHFCIKFNFEENSHNFLNEIPIYTNL